MAKKKKKIRRKAKVKLRKAARAARKRPVPKRRKKLIKKRLIKRVRRVKQKARRKKLPVKTRRVKRVKFKRKARPKRKKPVRLKRVKRRPKIIRRKRKIIVKRKVPKRAKRARRKKIIYSSLLRYTLNPNHEFYSELRSLVLKSSPAEKERLTGKILRLGRIRLAVISGIFLSSGGSQFNGDGSISDLFIVGDDIDRKKLRLFLRSLEAEVGREVRFTIMDKDEFEYRLGMFDRFVRVLLEGPHEKIINKLGL